MYWKISHCKLWWISRNALTHVKCKWKGYEGSSITTQSPFTLFKKTKNEIHTIQKKKRKYKMRNAKSKENKYKGLIAGIYQGRYYFNNHFSPFQMQTSSRHLVHTCMKYVYSRCLEGPLGTYFGGTIPWFQCCRAPSSQHYHHQCQRHCHHQHHRRRHP